eukprot:1068017-Amphidinium_carterae.1
MEQREPAILHLFALEVHAPTHVNTCRMMQSQTHKVDGGPSCVVNLLCRHTCQKWTCVLKGIQ